MRALVFHGKDDLRLDEVEEPRVSPGHVKVAPKFAGICGSDLHEWLEGPNYCPQSPHPLTGGQVPLTFGHEFSGIVEEVGEGVTTFQPGDRVCIEPILWDDECDPCKVGAHNSCVNGGFIGLSGGGGGMSEHVLVRQESLYKLPDNVSLEVGALIEPLAVGWHAVKSSPFKSGDAVLVLGGGPIGLSVIQALVAKKPSKLIVSELSQARKDFARHFGATDIIDPTQENLVERVRELTNNRGVEVVFDTAGIQAAVDQGFDALRVRGTYVNIALWGHGCTIHPLKILLKEQKYMGIVTYARGEFGEVIDAVNRGSIKPEAMITKIVPLHDAVEEGFRAVVRDRAKQVKVLIEV